MEAVLRSLEGAAADAPVVLSIEDLHWADAATRELLAFLAPSRQPARVRLVGTVRTDEEQGALRPMLVELDRSGLLERLDVGPLGDDEIDRVVAGIIGPSKPDGALLDAVRRRSGGNPFFIEELVAAAKGGHASLPPSLGEILLARVASLPGPVQQLLRHMAVLGDDVF